MDTVLLVIGVLGFGAVVIAAYVFISAARNYVSENNHNDQQYSSISSSGSHIERSSRDRRQLFQFDFPLIINGLMIPAERRAVQDRRIATA